MRADAATLCLLVLGTGCIDDLLEAPYVLSTGLGEGASTLSPSASQTLFVAGRGGVFEVDGEGRARKLRTDAATIVVGHKAWLAVGDAGGIGFGPAPAEGEWSAGARIGVRDTIDAQAWCGDALLALTPTGLWLTTPDSATPTRWADAPPDARSLALSGATSPCERALVTTATGLLRVGPDGSEPAATDLVDGRAAAVDSYGRTWVIQGDPLAIWRIDQGVPQRFAGHLGDVVDAHFGTGGLLHPDNLYLLNADGSIDYVRITPP